MDVRSNTAIGKCLQALRAKSGFTQAELAKRLGKPQSYISKIEMGERSLRLHELFPYSRALGLSPAEIIAEIERFCPDIAYLPDLKEGH